VTQSPLRLADDPAAVPVRDAATVVLLRDGPAGVEAFLLQRVRALAFAAGMSVFPGGVVDERDADADIGWVGPPPAAWAAALGAPEPLARALVCAAVRETFEECGVLLAGPSAGAVCRVDGPQWADERVALEGGELSLAGLLARRGLLLRADLLRPWAHWITPLGERRRYDTRFFVAALPSGQSTQDGAGEADTVVWLPPADALAQAGRAERGLLPPTSVTLQEIAAHRTVADVLAAAEHRVITPIVPRLDQDPDGGVVVVLPDGRRIVPLVPAARRP
jgi:8-oxo-dGTP pyrophosphatase MutT (NUDIX family)